MVKLKVSASQACYLRDLKLHISQEEKERNENRAADEEKKRFVLCLFSVNKPEKKRKSEADYVTAKNVHRPMNTEIEP